MLMPIMPFRKKKCTSDLKIKAILFFKENNNGQTVEKRKTHQIY